MTQMQSDIMLMVSAVNLAFCLALVHVRSQHFALQKSIFVGRETYQFLPDSIMSSASLNTLYNML